VILDRNKIARLEAENERLQSELGALADEVEELRARMEFGE
jgi:predicted nuclease with TOPRIM domain